MAEPQDIAPEAAQGLLQCLSYYLPNVSGLTLAAAEIARVAGNAGYPVRVLTSRPRGGAGRCELDGVPVWQAWTLGRIGKAPFMPGLGWTAWRAMAGMGVVGIHLPNADAGLLALIARLRGRRVLLQYHCAISTAGLAGRVARGLAAGPHLVAGLLASQILVVSPDYARQSRFCRLFWRKLVFVTPPVPIKLLQPLNRHRPARAATAALRIGYVGRIARQKSLPLLLQAFAGLGAHLGRRVDLDLIGPAEAVVGEDDWRAILQHAAEAGSPVQYLGVQGPDALRESYAGFDLLVLPSTDRQESFGLVQVEAMVQGTPVVAFDLPGVCEPIQQTGMGLLARAGSVSDLRRAMIEVLQNGPAAQPGPAALLQQFGPEITCAAYLAALRPRSR